MSRKVAIIGLGYAGLHTAVAFGRKKEVMGFDLDEARIRDLKKNHDRNGDFSAAMLKECKIKFVNNIEEIKPCNFFVIIVPTPVKSGNEPDFSYLQSASKLVGQVLKEGDIVVNESTVYPGATEEVCVPILEKESNLKYQHQFTMGYSPERINPGDNVHTISNTVKIVAGSNAETLKIISKEYGAITDAGVLPVSNIKTAEAVKIVENIQRDTNIALVNELATFFHLLDIDTLEVIDAAKTKWNFVPYQPGMVGGHCIGVDPYYLIYKAHTLCFPLHVIIAARNANEYMSRFIAEVTIKYLVKNALIKKNTKVAILGITYKENYNDVRNSKAVSIGNHLASYGIRTFFYDPLADKKTTMNEYGFALSEWDSLDNLAAMIITVSHREFKKLRAEDYIKKLQPNGFIVDVKGLLNPTEFEKKGITVWKL